MPTDITKTLRKALKELQTEKDKIERQIAALENALTGVGRRAAWRRARRPAKAKKRGRKAMSVAQRKAVGRRMKAYWKKRRAEAAKAKGVGGK
jgi:gamma-glutamylcysteine synthetase